MAKYVLDKLLDIREKRKSDMAQQVTKARADLQKAEEACKVAEQALNDFIAEKPQKQARLYATVMNQIVKREQMDKLKAALADLERQQQHLADKLQQAQDNVAQAHKALEEAQRNLLLASKNVMKLDAHKETWLEKEAKIEAENVEKEMEDLHPVISPVGEDDDAL